jgi:protein TonB
MFEQSMLLDSAPGRKAGALAASFTMQTLGAVILLLLPWMYTERLPFEQPWLPLVLRPVAEAPPMERPVRPERAVERSTPRVFQAPARVPRLSTLSPIPDDALSLDFGIGAPMPVPVLPQTGSLPHVDAVPPLVHPVAVDLAPQRIVQSSGAQEAKLIHKVLPVYPPLAMLTRVSGTVHLTGIIAIDGTIRDLQVESGPPLLIQAALETVRQWVYQPTLLSGMPVEVITSINVTFTLTP